MENMWYIEFSEGIIDDDGVDRTRRCFTSPEALSNFLHDKYGEALCLNGIPAFIEAPGWAEGACLDEEGMFMLGVDEEEYNNSFTIAIRSID